MVKNRMKEAVRVGDKFVEKDLKNGIYQKINILRLIIIFLTVIVLLQGPHFLLETGHDYLTKLFYVIEILTVIVFNIIGYLTFKHLKKWLETYKKITSLLG